MRLEKEKEAKEMSQTKTASGANTPVHVKVRRIQDKINKDKGMSQPDAAKMIQPTLVSFMDIRGRLKGHQEAPRQQMSSKPGHNQREGLGPSEEFSTPGGNGKERARPPMKGSPEHLLFQEAKIVARGRDRSGQTWDPGEVNLVGQGRSCSNVPEEGGKARKPRLDPG